MLGGEPTEVIITSVGQSHGHVYYESDVNSSSRRAARALSRGALCGGWHIGAHGQPVAILPHGEFSVTTIHRWGGDLVNAPDRAGEVLGIAGDEVAVFKMGLV